MSQNTRFNLCEMSYLIFINPNVLRQLIILLNCILTVKTTVTLLNILYLRKNSSVNFDEADKLTNVSQLNWQSGKVHTQNKHNTQAAKARGRERERDAER